MKLRKLVVTVVGLAAGLFAMSVMISTSLAQQQQWSWPEKAKNLKVLPKDTDSQKLRAVMVGYTHALGVRCNYCHVGKEGQPLGAFDFPSDSNPKKDVARGMMKMVDSINTQLTRIVPDAKDRVTVGCITCHHGVPRPRTLADELGLAYDVAGVDSTISRYRTLRARYQGSAAYDFGEGTLGDVAHRALDKKDAAGAIALLKLNIEQFPESGFAHGSLGEAYLAAGDTTHAIAEYERSVQLDPKNDRAVKTLERLKGH